MPENLTQRSDGSNVNVTAPATGWLNGNSLGQRREDIFKRLQQSAEQCILNYSGRKELATEKDDVVAELCETLDEAFSYGIRQQQNAAVLTATSLFHNMQEIVTGVSNSNSANDTTFWDFCQAHLTPHERERYESLRHVWTKCGRGRAFVRATLNEHSLQRYLFSWLSSEELLCLYYTPWSCLLHIDTSKQIANILGSLKGILFALNVDSTELNVATRYHPPATAKEEPIIYAPTPQPTAEQKIKRRSNIIERPITSTNSTEDLVSVLHAAESNHQEEPIAIAQATEEIATNVIEIDSTPCDPIEPELAFLKEPLPDLNTKNYRADCVNGMVTVAQVHSEYEEDKSDTSSQYSKSSSLQGSAANQTALEEKLREMNERCALLETRVAQLSLENRQLVRRLTQHFNESGINPNSSLASNYLITIPHVLLLKSKRATTGYHAYEIHITMRQHLEHWVLLRRYREFYKLHQSLLRTHPSVAATVEFPPKKHFGNMNKVFVEERRQQLQIYLLNLVELLPQVEACKSKAELQKVFPFLRDR